MRLLIPYSMPDPVNRSLSPEVVAVIDAALSDVERTFPGVSTDLQVRDEVQAAVARALAPLEAETRRALEALEPAALTGVTEANTRRALARVTEAGGSSA